MMLSNYKELQRDYNANTAINKLINNNNGTERLEQDIPVNI